MPLSSWYSAILIARGGMPPPDCGRASRSKNFFRSCSRYSKTSVSFFSVWITSCSRTCSGAAARAVDVADRRAEVALVLRLEPIFGEGDPSTSDSWLIYDAIRALPDLLNLLVLLHLRSGPACSVRGQNRGAGWQSPPAVSARRRGCAIFRRVGGWCHPRGGAHPLWAILARGFAGAGGVGKAWKAADLEGPRRAPTKLLYDLPTSPATAASRRP